MRDRGREEVVGLVALTLGGREAERPDELRQEVELLDQFVVEDSPALVAGEELVPVRRHEQRVPADECGTRLLGLPEAHEEVRESDERVARLALRAPHRLGQRVVRPVSQGVAVDHEQRLLGP